MVRQQSSIAAALETVHNLRREIDQVRDDLSGDLAQTTRTHANQGDRLDDLGKEMVRQQSSIAAALETVHNLRREIDQVRDDLSGHADRCVR